MSWRALDTMPINMYKAFSEGHNHPLQWTWPRWRPYYDDHSLLDNPVLLKSSMSVSNQKALGNDLWDQCDLCCTYHVLFYCRTGLFTEKVEYPFAIRMYLSQRIIVVYEIFFSCALDTKFWLKTFLLGNHYNTICDTARSQCYSYRV